MGAALSLTNCANPELAQFEQALATHDSATKALGEWCKARGIADPATIVAQRVAGDALPLPKADAELLVAQDEPVGFRHVRLVCGTSVLSEAYNWYVPSRLTAEMNAALNSSDVPFGKVAASLQFTRQRLSSRRGRAAGCPKGTVLSQRGLLLLPDGRPLALLLECYRAEALAEARG